MMLRENPRIRTLQTRLIQAREQLQEALAEATRGEVKDYVFTTTNGPAKLSALFGGQRDLILIHNMGTTCPNCTMWADGFNGLYPHIADRASFVVVSPDAPDRQAAFAASRGWRFPMASCGGTTFAADMGFADDKGRAQPGVSAFQMQDGAIVRSSAAGFDETDNFCPVWRLFDLLADGADGWRAKVRYG